MDFLMRIWKTSGNSSTTSGWLWETFQWVEVQPWQIVLEPVKFQLLQLIWPQQNIVEAQNSNTYMKPACQKSGARNLM